MMPYIPPVWLWGSQAFTYRSSYIPNYGVGRSCFDSTNETTIKFCLKLMEMEHNATMAYVKMVQTQIDTFNAIGIIFLFFSLLALGIVLYHLFGGIIIRGKKYDEGN